MHFSTIKVFLQIFYSDENILWKKEESTGRETKMIKGATKEEAKGKEERTLPFLEHFLFLVFVEVSIMLR